MHAFLVSAVPGAPSSGVSLCALLSAAAKAHALVPALAWLAEYLPTALAPVDASQLRAAILAAAFTPSPALAWPSCRDTAHAAVQSLADAPTQYAEQPGAPAADDALILEDTLSAAAPASSRSAVPEGRLSDASVDLLEVGTTLGTSRGSAGLGSGAWRQGGAADVHALLLLDLATALGMVVQLASSACLVPGSACMSVLGWAVRSRLDACLRAVPEALTAATRLLRWPADLDALRLDSVLQESTGRVRCFWSHGSMHVAGRC